MIKLNIPEANSSLPIPQANQEIVNFLSQRRSAKILDLDATIGPNDEEFENILKLATRVPDHGKIAPWRFISLTGKARFNYGKKLADLYKSKNHKMDENHYNSEANMFLRGHRVLVMISSPILHPKVPVWEQELSAGAIGYSLILSSFGFGYNATWLSEWPMFDEDAKAIFGLEQNERIFGFLYFGRAKSEPQERDRPDISKIYQAWDK